MNRGIPGGSALDAAREAVASSRKLAEERDTVSQELARDLRKLGVLLHGLGEREAGLAAVLEAVSISRTLAKRSGQEKSEKWRADDLLAKRLAQLAVLLDADLSSRKASIDTMREAAGIFGMLARISPSWYRHHLAYCFHFLRVRLNAFGPSEPSLAAARDEANIYGSLAKWLPCVFAIDFRRSVQQLRYQLWAAGPDPDSDAGLEAAERLATVLGFTISRPHVPVLASETCS
jgi:hypothetical protein